MKIQTYVRSLPVVHCDLVPQRAPTVEGEHAGVADGKYMNSMRRGGQKII